MYIFVDLSLLDRYISEEPKGKANKSKEWAKRRVGRARSKKEGMGGPPPPKKRVVRQLWSLKAIFVTLFFLKF